MLASFSFFYTYIHTYILQHTLIFAVDPRLNWLSSTLFDDISFSIPAPRHGEADWNLKSEIRLFALPHAAGKVSHHHAFCVYYVST